MGLKYFRLVHLWNQAPEWANFLHVTYDIIALDRNIEFFHTYNPTSLRAHI